jgi:hypothetical protein
MGILRENISRRLNNLGHILTIRYASLRNSSTWCKSDFVRLSRETPCFLRASLNREVMSVISGAFIQCRHEVPELGRNAGNSAKCHLGKEALGTVAYPV